MTAPVDQRSLPIALSKNNSVGMLITDNMLGKQEPQAVGPMDGPEPSPEELLALVELLQQQGMNMDQVPADLKVRGPMFRACQGKSWACVCVWAGHGG